MSSFPSNFIRPWAGLGPECPEFVFSQRNSKFIFLRFFLTLLGRWVLGSIVLNKGKIANACNKEPGVIPNNKRSYVLIPPKRIRRENTNDILREAVKSFNKFASADPSEAFINIMREENERSRAHKFGMAEMHMRIMPMFMTGSSVQEPSQSLAYQRNDLSLLPNKNDLSLLPNNLSFLHIIIFETF